jgi:hypothetical protein
MGAINRDINDESHTEGSVSKHFPNLNCKTY